MLIVSFSINNGPPADATGAQQAAFGQHNQAAILWGALLQAVGPVLIVVFVFAIVVLAGATVRLAGWMTFFGAATLMMVSVGEIVLYIGALQPRPTTIAASSYALINSIQHLYFIAAAPALFLPLGLVILGSNVLPRILGYLAIMLAAGYAIAGIATLLDLRIPNAVQFSASVQVLWFLAAAITFIIRGRRAASSQGLPARVQVGGMFGHT